MRWEYPKMDFMFRGTIAAIDKYLTRQPIVKMTHHGLIVNNVVISKNKRIFKVFGGEMWASLSVRPLAEAINSGKVKEHLLDRIEIDKKTWELYNDGKEMSKQKQFTARRINGYKRMGLIK